MVCDNMHVSSGSGCFCRSEGGMLSCAELSRFFQNLPEVTNVQKKLWTKGDLWMLLAAWRWIAVTRFKIS